MGLGRVSGSVEPPALLCVVFYKTLLLLPAAGVISWFDSVLADCGQAV